MKWVALMSVLGLAIVLSIDGGSQVDEVPFEAPVADLPPGPANTVLEDTADVAAPPSAAGDERVETAVASTIEEAPRPTRFTLTGSLVHPDQDLLRRAQVELSFGDHERDVAVDGEGRFEATVEQTVKTITPLVDGVPMGAARKTSHLFARGRAAIDLGPIPIGDPVSLVVEIAESSATVEDLELWAYPKAGSDPSSYAERMKLPWSLGLFGESDAFPVSSTCLGGQVVALGEDLVGRSLIQPDAVDVQRAHAEIFLEPLRTYRFAVQEGEAPVADAIVILHGELDFLRTVNAADGRRIPISGRTDENGWLTLTSLPPSLVDHVAVRRQSGSSITVPLDPSAARQVISLGEGCSTPAFQVTVRDARGVSVPDARVALGGESLPYVMGAAVARSGDPRGSTLRVEAEGFAPYARVLTECPPESEVVLRRARSLRVAVMDQDGAPVSGARARVKADPAASFLGQVGRTDALGVVVLEAVPADRDLVLSVTPPEPLACWRAVCDGSGATATSLNVVVHVPRDRAEVSVTLERRPESFGSIVVRAFDARTGIDLAIDRLAVSARLGPSRHETVFVSPEYGLAESVIDVVPCGSHLLWVHTARGDASVVQVDVTRDQVLVVTLPIASSDELAGVVRPGSAPGFPLDTAIVSGTVTGLGFESPYTPDHRLWPVQAVATCDDAGAFRLQNLMAATYELRVTRPFNNMPSVVIEPDDRQRTIEIAWQE